MDEEGDGGARWPGVERFTRAAGEELLERLRQGESIGELPTLAESFALLAELPLRLDTPPVDALPPEDAEQALGVLRRTDELLGQIERGAVVADNPALLSAEADLLAEARRLALRARTAPVAQAAALDEAAFVLRGRALGLAGDVVAATAEPPTDADGESEPSIEAQP